MSGQLMSSLRSLLDYHNRNGFDPYGMGEFWEDVLHGALSDPANRNGATIRETFTVLELAADLLSTEDFASCFERAASRSIKSDTEPAQSEYKIALQSFKDVVTAFGIAVAIREGAALRVLDSWVRRSALGLSKMGQKSPSNHQELCLELLTSAKNPNATERCLHELGFGWSVRFTVLQFLQERRQHEFVKLHVLLHVDRETSPPEHGLASLTLELLKGQGCLVRHPEMLQFFGEDWNGGFTDVWNACSSSFRGCDVVWRLQPSVPLPYLHGRSAQSALYAGLYCLANRIAYPQHIAFTGTIKEGLVGPVDGVFNGAIPGKELLSAMRHNQIKLVVCPKESLPAETCINDFQQQSGVELTGVFRVNEIAEIIDESSRKTSLPVAADFQKSVSKNLIEQEEAFNEASTRHGRSAGVMGSPGFNHWWVFAMVGLTLSACTATFLWHYSGLFRHKAPADTPPVVKSASLENLKISIIRGVSENKTVELTAENTRHLITGGRSERIQYVDEFFAPIDSNDLVVLQGNFQIPTYWAYIWVDANGLIEINAISDSQEANFCSARDAANKCQALSFNDEPSGGNAVFLVQSDKPIDKIEIEHSLAVLGPPPPEPAATLSTRGGFPVTLLKWDEYQERLRSILGTSISVASIVHLRNGVAKNSHFQSPDSTKAAQ